MLDLSSRPTLRTTVRLAGLALLAGLGLVGATLRPALAAPSSWEIGCAQSVVSPGYGDGLRVMNCMRQKDCQQMADAKGATMTGMGCFFVEPTAHAPAATALRPHTAKSN